MRLFISLVILSIYTITATHGYDNPFESGLFEQESSVSAISRITLKPVRLTNIQNRTRYLESQKWLGKAKTRLIRMVRDGEGVVVGNREGYGESIDKKNAISSNYLLEDRIDALERFIKKLDIYFIALAMTENAQGSEQIRLSKIADQKFREAMQSYNTLIYLFR